MNCSQPIFKSFQLKKLKSRCKSANNNNNNSNAVNTMNSNTANVNSNNKKIKDMKRIRTPLDMPTTDPGSDLLFSTDDEYFFDDGYGTVPRVRRTLLQSELQRKYIDEVNIFEKLYKTPPELLVTPAKHSQQKLNIQSLAPIQTEDSSSKKCIGPNSPEFPPIIGSVIARRNNSWHNLNNKCIPKIR